jgi:hypothetical protein
VNESRGKIRIAAAAATGTLAQILIQIIAQLRAQGEARYVIL